MFSDPLGLIFAFTTGIFVLFSPCSFPLLPGYVSYYLGAKTSLRKAITSGLLCTTGFLTVFSIIGIFTSLIGDFLSSYIPFLDLIVGLIIISMGLLTLLDVNFPMISSVLSFLKIGNKKSFLGIFLYGLLYGLAALSCSAPVFFAVLFYAASSGGVYHSLIIFVFYAMGMGLPLILTSILVAKANDLILRKMSQSTRILKKISGAILIIVGSYLAIISFSIPGF